MTGIQALERTMPDIPMKPGRSVKREFEYIRHGTQTLIASFNVATGAIDISLFIINGSNQPRKMGTSFKQVCSI
jgi:hypothetical protein